MIGVARARHGMRKAAQQLPDKRIVVAESGGAAVDRIDILGIGQIERFDRNDGALIVKSDLDCLLLKHYRIEKRILLSLAADIVPDFIIKGADQRWCTKLRGHVFTVRCSRLDLGQLVGIEDVAAAGNGRLAGR